MIQDYIDRPLQLINYNKRKFHLRVYVVAVGNLNVYVYEVCYYNLNFGFDVDLDYFKQYFQKGYT